MLFQIQNGHSEAFISEWPFFNLLFFEDDRPLSGGRPLRGVGGYL